MIKYGDRLYSKIIILSNFLLFLFSATLGAQNPGDQVFNEPHIFEVRFHFDQLDFLDSLHKSHETGDYIPGHVTIDGVIYDEVGVRFKGHSSYLFYPGDKKPFRIKFNKYKDHRFDGLKKINLNNGWGNPTMLREKIHLDFLKRKGIPAPRANFARVYIDSVYWGFYSLVEHVDKVFLKSHYRDDDGNLYKAEKSTLEWKGGNQEDYYEDLELKTNEKENNWSNLINFLEILNNTLNAEFPLKLDEVFNAESFLKAIASDNLFVNLDSYIGSATNYYLYDHPLTGQFEWIVWDVNLTLSARNGRSDLDILYSIPQRPLLHRLLQIEKYRSQYLNIIQSYVENDFTEEKIFSEIDRLAEFIREDYQADTSKMYTNEETEQAIYQEVSGIPGLKPFILERRKNVMIQLDSLANTVSSLNASIQSQPTKIILHPNYPNPFNPSTKIKYKLPGTNYVQLSIYNLLGQKVATLISSHQSPGNYQIQWDARGLSSGIYYYQLEAGDFREVKKMLVVK